MKKYPDEFLTTVNRGFKIYKYDLPVGYAAIFKILTEHLHKC